MPGAGVGGFVWGTNVYTLDSTLALAAVHAGLLKTGESKVVGRMAREARR